MTQLTFETIPQDNPEFKRLFQGLIAQDNQREQKGVFASTNEANKYLGWLKDSLRQEDRLEIIVALNPKGEPVGASLVAVYDNGRFARQVYEGTTSDMWNPSHTTADRFAIETALRKEAAETHPVVFGEMTPQQFAKQNGLALSAAGIQKVKFPEKWCGDDFILVATGNPDKIMAALPEAIAAHTWGIDGKPRSADQSVAPDYEDYNPFIAAAREGKISLKRPPVSEAQRLAVDTVKTAGTTDVKPSDAAEDLTSAPNQPGKPKEIKK